MKRILLFLCALALLSGCKSKKDLLLPNISGAAGEVVIIMKVQLHDTALKDSIRNVLIEEFPMLPQPEPWFKPIFITETGFNSVMQKHRNLIQVKIGKEYAKPSLNFQYDIWAKTQCVIVASGPDVSSLAAYISQHGARIRDVFEQAEINRNTSNIKKYEEKLLRQEVEKRFGCSLYFPNGYISRKVSPDFIWYSLETPKTSQGVFIYTYPYTGQKIDGNYLISKRNEFLKNNVPGSLPNTYMITSPVVSPLIQVLKQNNKDKLTLIQMRGLWDVQNDYMGGPFISQTVLDTANQRIVTIEAYVYAPKGDKRNLIRQTYSILRTFELKAANP